MMIEFSATIDARVTDVRRHDVARHKTDTVGHIRFRPGQEPAFVPAPGVVIALGELQQILDRLRDLRR